MQGLGRFPDAPRAAPRAPPRPFVSMVRRHSSNKVCFATRSKKALLEVGTLAGARDALRTGKAQGLLWETSAAKALVDAGELRRVGEVRRA